MHIRHVSLLLFATLALISGARAQDPSGIALGFNPNTVYSGGEIDSVDMSNDRLTLHIPILEDHSQRGKLNFTYSIGMASSGAWTGYCTPPTSHTNCQWSFGKYGLAGLSFLMDGALHSGVQTYYDKPDALRYLVYDAIEASGAVHHLGTTSTSVTPAESIDGSGIRSSPTLGLINKDGVQFGALIGSAMGIKDANGNEISTTADSSCFVWRLGTFIASGPGSSSNCNLTTIDTLGRAWSWTATTDVSGCPVAATFAYLWDTPGPANVNNGNRTFKFCYSLVTISTQFSQQYYAEDSGASTFLTGVVLPQGTAWRFDYNNYGDLAKLYLPTGGTISYTWTSNFINTCIGVIGEQALRQVVSRTVYDGTNSYTWNYNGDKVTDPLGNDTVYTSEDYCSEAIKEIQYYSGSTSTGKLLKTETTNFQRLDDPYLSDFGLSGFGGYSYSKLSRTTTWAVNNQVSQIQYTPDSGFTFIDTNPNGQGRSTHHSVYGLVASESHFDYGTGASGALLSTTNTSYVAFSNPNYVTANLLNLRSSEVTLAGNGNKCAEMDSGYDSPAQIVTSGVSMQHVAAPTPGALGNLTSITRQLYSNPCQSANPTGTPLTTNRYVYDTGMLNKSVDPKLNPTTYLYSNTYYGAYPTNITNALNQSAVYTYDFNTGLLTLETDPNSQNTSFSYDAETLRNTQVNYPDGGQSSYCYSDTSAEGCASGPPYAAITTKKITTSINLVSKVVTDGLGRPAHSMLTSDPSGSDLIDTTYDALARKSSVTNPYRTSGNVVVSTEGTTSYQYDALNRPILVTKPDGSKVQTAYCGSTTLVTDESGRWRRSKTDGLGRLTEVDEPNSTTATVNVCPGSGEPIWITTYSYDALDDLTGVTQSGSRQRTFAFDSLKRMTSSNNPEAGTATYTYDGDNNVQTKADARGVTITYGWEALNRMSSRTYSNGDPGVTYTYDQTTCVVVTSCYNIGRRTSMIDAGGSETWAYDKIGREWGEQRKTNGITKNTSYTYNLDGSPATLVYPALHKNS